MAKMLILTGPQGAGNHLWSKVFSLHPEVYGWKSLLENYWEAHRFAEPFCKHWRDHNLLKEFDWTQSEYYFTSISLPLGIVGSDVNPIWLPDVLGFINTVKSLGIEVQVAVCGRDQTILEYQQCRIRNTFTYPMFLEILPQIENPMFLSYELLHLYRGQYLNSLDVNIPVAWNDPKVHEIVKDDSNKKYIHSIDEYVLDQCNVTGISVKELPYYE
jgi:hypothetical protein